MRLLRYSEGLMVKAVKQTKAAMKELANIGEFLGGFKRAKGEEPEIIYISKKQRDTLGIEVGEKLMVKEWRVV